MTPALVQGENTFHVRQQWQENPDESLYGLGENQLDLTEIKGFDLDLWQHNGTMAIPFLLSSRGWGVLWDNTSLTHFGDLREFQPIPGINLATSRPTARGKPVVWGYSNLLRTRLPANTSFRPSPTEDLKSGSTANS